jgi:hypothetical protein
VVTDFIDYSWDQYARLFHIFGATIHLSYLIIFSIYTNLVYVERNFDQRIPLLWTMLILLIYPFYYEMMAISKNGYKNYFSDLWNYLDQAHIWFGLANIFVQRF